MSEEPEDDEDRRSAYMGTRVGIRGALGVALGFGLNVCKRE